MDDTTYQRVKSAAVNVNRVLGDEGGMTIDKKMSLLFLAKDDLAMAIRDVKKARDEDVLMRGFTQTSIDLVVDDMDDDDPDAL